VNRVPTVAWLRPELASSKSKKLQERDFWMVGNEDTVEALKSLENINKILGTNVPYNPPIEIVRTILNNLVIIGLGAVAFFMRNFVLQIVQIKPIWYAGTALLFILCIGGTAYNMIHGVPNFRYA